MKGSVCLCVGENDQKFLDLASEMKRSIGKYSESSEQIVYPVRNADHAVHVERPEVLIDLLHAFLNNVT